jgi:hypothetical protein
MCNVDGNVTECSDARFVSVSTDVGFRWSDFMRDSYAKSSLC